MTRAPYQVLVIPYRVRSSTDEPQFCVLKRYDAGYWQWVAGGGEDAEAPFEAAAREFEEECGISLPSSLLALQSRSSIPSQFFPDRVHWGSDCHVIPEYAFALDVGAQEIIVGREHSEAKWCSYDEAVGLLKWDSNRTALWELRCRLTALRGPEAAGVQG